VTTYTHSRLGSHGRLGNQIWQVIGTIGLAERNQATARLDGWWPGREWTSIPDEYFEPIVSGDVVDTFHHEGGYLQDPQLIPTVWDRSWLRCDHTPPKEQRALLRGATGVHVRRTDYLDKHRPHGVIPKDYYLDNWPTGRVFVFTDDPAWCERHLPGEIIHTPNAWADWHYLAACGAHLIGNSSFAWWAAHQAGGPVTCPKPWFTGEHAMDRLILDHWEAREWTTAHW